MVSSPTEPLNSHGFCDWPAGKNRGNFKIQWLVKDFQHLNRKANIFILFLQCCSNFTFQKSDFSNDHTLLPFSSSEENKIIVAYRKRKKKFEKPVRKLHRSILVFKKLFFHNVGALHHSFEFL